MSLVTLYWRVTMNVLIVVFNSVLCTFAFFVFLLFLYFWRKKLLQQNLCCGKRFCSLFSNWTLSASSPQISTSTFCHCQVLAVLYLRHKYRHKYDRNTDTTLIQTQILFSKFFLKCAGVLSSRQMKQ